MNIEITGKVMRGDGYGRKIGFPTINLSVKKEDLPTSGVYGGKVILEGKEYRAGIVIGPKDKAEAHLIGYEGDAYGKEALILPEKFIREFQNFGSEGELIEQIKKDLIKC